jgi:hypothetical protein
VVVATTDNPGSAEVCPAEGLQAARSRILTRIRILLLMQSFLRSGKAYRKGYKVNLVEIRCLPG